MYPWRDEVETALNTSYSRPSWCTAVPTAPCARVWITRDENLSRGIYHLRGDAFRLTECVSPPLLLALSFTRLLLARTQFKFEAVNGLRREELGSTESMTKEQASLEIKIEVNAALVAKTFRGTGNEAPVSRTRFSNLLFFFSVPS